MSPVGAKDFSRIFRPLRGSVLNDTLPTAFGRGYDLSPLRGSIRTRLSPRYFVPKLASKPSYFLDRLLTKGGEWGWNDTYHQDSPLRTPLLSRTKIHETADNNSPGKTPFSGENFS